MKLAGCGWRPRWVSHLGSIKGCLEYLGVEMSDGWLYGGTGHAFVLNIHDELCPSGPTAWKSAKLFEHGNTLGYKIDGYFGFKNQEDFSELQKKAFDRVRTSIDEGIPCYGWELDIPEYYVVNGYDDVGYYYSGAGCDDGAGPKAWSELADTGIGCLEMYSIRSSVADADATIVKNALTFALDISRRQNEWVFDGYHSGADGYETWIRALESGKASDMGTRYNAGVWHECRSFAVEFFDEAGNRLPSSLHDLLGEARNRYAKVAENLKIVTGLYPWTEKKSEAETLPVDETSKEAIFALERAMAAELQGLETIEEIIKHL